MKLNVSSHGEPWSVDVDAPVLFSQNDPGDHQDMMGIMFSISMQ